MRESGKHIFVSSLKVSNIFRNMKQGAPHIKTCLHFIFDVAMLINFTQPTLTEKII